MKLDQFERQMAAVEREMHSLKLKDDALAREIAHAQDDIQRLKQQLGACERDKQVCCETLVDTAQCRVLIA